MKSVKAPILALASVMTMICGTAHAESRRFGLYQVTTNNRHWHLKVMSDRFSGVRRCELRSRDGRTVYVSHALGFRLPGTSKLLDGQFRIDDGVAQSVRDQLPELARLRVATDRITSLRASRTYLPVSLLSAARFVAISPTFGARPRRFDLQGFAPLYSKATALGCVDGTWVIPPANRPTTQVQMASLRSGNQTFSNALEDNWGRLSPPKISDTVAISGVEPLDNGTQRDVAAAPAGPAGQCWRDASGRLPSR